MASTQFSTLHDADDDDTRLVERFELDMPSEADRRRNSSVVTRVRNAVVTSPRLQCGLIAGLVVFIVVVVTAATIIFPHDSSNGDDQGVLTVLIVGDWGRRGTVYTVLHACMADGDAVEPHRALILPRVSQPDTGRRTNGRHCGEGEPGFHHFRGRWLAWSVAAHAVCTELTSTPCYFLLRETTFTVGEASSVV